MSPSPFDQTLVYIKNFKNIGNSIGENFKNFSDDIALVLFNVNSAIDLFQKLLWRYFSGTIQRNDKLTKWSNIQINNGNNMVWERESSEESGAVYLSSRSSRAPWKKATARSHESEKTERRATQSLLYIVSREKLMPSAGSGSSGSTISGGGATFHVPSEFPYRHKQSRSAPAKRKQITPPIHDAGEGNRVEIDREGAMLVLTHLDCTARRTSRGLRNKTRG